MRNEEQRKMLQTQQSDRKKSYHIHYVRDVMLNASSNCLVKIIKSFSSVSYSYAD